MAWIDTHAHLDDEALRNQVDEVLSLCDQSGVESIVSVGTTVDSSRGCVALANRYSSIYASVGIHPNYCHQASDSDWDAIKAMTSQPRVVAVGETGLDKYWDDCPWDIQVDYFHRHCRLSREMQLPMIIHMRECETEMLEQLRIAHRDGPLLGVMHSFTGDVDMAMHCIELGLYISFAGMLTYKKSSELRQVAAELPEDRILVETDSPYLSPEPFRSKRPNLPSQVVHTAQCLANARCISAERLSQVTVANTKRLFTRIR
jgi:TatD DNase family protein